MRERIRLEVEVPVPVPVPVQEQGATKRMVVGPKLALRHRCDEASYNPERISTTAFAVTSSAVEHVSMYACMYVCTYVCRLAIQ